MVNKLVYNTVLSQCFSNCEKYLIAGNIYGDVSVFVIDKLINPAHLPTTEIRKPHFNFTANKDQPIWSLVMADKFLIVGSVNDISGWNFKSLLAKTTTKPTWTIKISSNIENFSININCLWYDSQAQRIVAACSDDTVHVYNLEDRTLIRKLEGHEDYVHWVHGDSSQIVSASEDGTVKLWDLKQEKYTNQIVPHKDPKLERPDFGKWMGSVTLNQDWLLCGGGPRLSLWHLRSFDMSTVFEHPDCAIQVTSFIDDHILAAGASEHVYQMSYDGALLSDIVATPTSVYSVLHRNTPSKIMSIAGSSNKMDLCTNFSYRDQIIAFK